MFLCGFVLDVAEMHGDDGYGATLFGSIAVAFDAQSPTVLFGMVLMLLVPKCWLGGHIRSTIRQNGYIEMTNKKVHL